jgi:hypothetical protein
LKEVVVTQKVMKQNAVTGQRPYTIEKQSMIRIILNIFSALKISSTTARGTAHDRLHHHIIIHHRRSSARQRTAYTELITHERQQHGSSRHSRAHHAGAAMPSAMLIQLPEWVGAAHA